MKILHILAGVPPGSGMAESVPTLCWHLRQLGHEVTLATLDGPLSEAARAAEAAGVRLVRFAPSFPRTLYFSWQMLRGLSALARTSDVVHVNGAWTFPVWWGCRCALRARKPLVMSPRGALNPVYLKHSAWKKRLAGWLDRTCLRRAAVIHATAACEREWIRDYLAGGEEKIAVVPNGVELPGKNAERRMSNSERSSGGKKTMLYLGRLHPLKGLDLLVEAWRSVRSSLVHYCDSALVADDQQTVGSGQSAEGSDSTHARMNLRTNELLLVIAGPDEQGTLKALKEQVVRLGLEASVKFVGSVYGEEKWRMLRSADVFVLPSRSENFGIVVAEALACSVPVICTKGAPWSELLGEGSNAAGAAGSKKVQTACRPGSKEGSNGLSASFISHPSSVADNGRCGWWVDVGVEPLAEALREALSLTDEERRIMGENGRRLVELKYRWESVAERMAVVYSGCLRG